MRHGAGSTSSPRTPTTSVVRFFLTSLGGQGSQLGLAHVEEIVAHPERGAVGAGDLDALLLPPVELGKALLHQPYRGAHVAFLRLRLEEHPQGR